MKLPALHTLTHWIRRINKDFCFVAAVYMCVYIYAVTAIPELIIPPISTDPFSFDIIASIIKAQGLLLEGMPAYFFTPFYAYFTYIIKLFTGIDRILFFRVLIFVQMSCFLVSTYFFRQLIYLIFNSKAIARIGLYLYAFFPPFIFYAVIPVKDTLTLSCIVLCLYSFFQYRNNPKISYVIGCGVFMSIAINLRASFAVMLPVCLYGVYKSPHKWRDGAVLIISSMLFILPFTARNYFVADEPVMLSCVGGIHYYIGNYGGAKGTYIRQKEIRSSAFGHYFDAKKAAETNTRTELSDVEMNSYWKEKTRTEIRMDKFRWYKLMLTKLFLFVNDQEISNNFNLSFFQETYIPFKLLSYPYTFGILFIFGILGFVFTSFRFKKVVVVSIILISAASLQIFIASRYRLPITPFLLIGMISCINSVREGKLKFSYKSGVVILILALVTYYPCFGSDNVFIRGAKKKHQYSESMMKRLEKEGRENFNTYIENRKKQYVKEYTPQRLLDAPDFSQFQLQ
ncbi:MAG: hypothetical protein C4541_07185 [Candidatus Auribacter fodinae]|jgi:4-amino-4-deoxy-L-arabinose transferase-like glycosyltransferase|uniref:Uncharacterized protein n=1 Tax=Candidatus Auribacter fodinae TaxID=2093366 RepID=A0A3A4R2N1_9BACT|nr:MAG: hypothetical protein C4541_07185 [Candidatus Auribacter fodinae]